MGLGWSEILVIIILVIILFGTGRIPAIMEDIAKGVKAFKKGLSDISDEVEKPVTAKVKVVKNKKVAQVKSKSSQPSKQVKKK
jgi:sec-independent protein translocase protein TatA